MNSRHWPGHAAPAAVLNLPWPENRAMILACITAMIAAVILVSTPGSYADVVEIGTDRVAYDRHDVILFSGMEDEGNSTVTLVIRDPSGNKVALQGIPFSDSTGHFTSAPIHVRNVFSKLGTYEVSAFSITQPVSDAVTMHIKYDGANARVVTAYDLRLLPIGDKTIRAQEPFSFQVRINDPGISVEQYSLDGNIPAGAAIDVQTGVFTWTPTAAQALGSYMLDVVVTAGISEVRETITIMVMEGLPVYHDYIDIDSQASVGFSTFMAPDMLPQHYVNRYNAEPEYRQWFDTHFPQYDSIYAAVGLPVPQGIASFVDTGVDPQHYVNRYNAEPEYRQWFDTHFPQYDSIYAAVGLPVPPMGICGEGTVLIHMTCSVADGTPAGAPAGSTGSEAMGNPGPVAYAADDTDDPAASGTMSNSSGCLIATAAYGSELAPQVQMLRELRDDVVLQTSSGSTFMSSFNSIYYVFSPTVADWERQNPIFREVVRAALLPLLGTLAMLQHAGIDTEAEMLGYGAAVITLNVGMYVAAPAAVIWKVYRYSAQIFSAHQAR